MRMLCRLAIGNLVTAWKLCTKYHLRYSFSATKNRNNWLIVSLLWVSSHSDIEDNENADELARMRSETGLSVGVPPLRPKVVVSTSLWRKPDFSKFKYKQTNTIAFLAVTFRLT